ncbi:MAG TPA: hypothetical protein VGG39_05805 [Polyangiaceae bacterium]|jgi:hypothetical protein
MNRSFLPALALLVLSTPACTAASGASSVPSRCEAIEIDPTRELAVTDADVVGDPDVQFSRVMAAVLGAPGGVPARAWMDAWSAMPGEGSLNDEVTAPWAATSATGLDLTRAPFELVAIVNRVDFAALTPAQPGELRFVYGLVTAGTRRPLTVNVELQLPPTHTPAEWAAEWHALGTLTGDAYRAGLLSIVDEVLAAPLAGQVRTQDARGDVPILLEFDLHGQAPLVPSLLVDQPAPSVSPADLAAYVSAHQDEVMTSSEILPASMLAGSARTVPPSFGLPGVPSDVATAFTNTTCTGCHTSEPAIDGTFHVSPLRRGTDALSTFLLDPSGPTDELSRRAEVMRGLLCQP